MRTDGKTFLVTGGGSGLGAATARRLAADGASVVVCDINAEGGEKAAAEVGGRARFVLTDVTDTDSMQAAVDAAVEQGRLRRRGDRVFWAGRGSPINACSRVTPSRPSGSRARASRRPLASTNSTS